MQLNIAYQETLKVIWKQIIFGVPPSKKNNYEPVTFPMKGAKAFYVCLSCRRIVSSAGCIDCYKQGKRFFDKQRSALMLSGEAKKYQEDFAIQCRKPAKPFSGDLILNVMIFYPHRRHDLEGDSIIMDSLQKARIIENDRQFKKKIIASEIDEQNPRADIEIWRIE